MADEEVKPPAVDFGVMIAFVAPGFVAFKALAYLSGTAKTWMEAATEKEQGVGVFLFVALASLSLGLLTAGVRDFFVDPLMQWECLGRFRVLSLHLDWSRIDTDQRASALILRDNYYRYYQFYSNMFVSLLIWTIARLWSLGLAGPCGIYWGVAFTCVALIISAWRSLDRYATGINELQRRTPSTAGVEPK